MAKVTLTANLKKYFPHAQLEVQGTTVRGLLNAMDALRPGFTGYILEDDGSVRRHVNLFLDGRLLRDKHNLDVPVDDRTQLHIMQALSGG